MPPQLQPVIKRKRSSIGSQIPMPPVGTFLEPTSLPINELFPDIPTNRTLAPSNQIPDQPNYGTLLETSASNRSSSQSDGLILSLLSRLSQVSSKTILLALSQIPTQAKQDFVHQLETLVSYTNTGASSGLDCHDESSASTNHSIVVASNVYSNIDTAHPSRVVSNNSRSSTNEAPAYDNYQNQYGTVYHCRPIARSMNAPQPIIPNASFDLNTANLSHQVNCPPYWDHDPRFPLQQSSQHKGSPGEELRRSNLAFSEFRDSQVPFKPTTIRISPRHYSSSTSGTGTSTSSYLSDTMSSGRIPCAYCGQAFKDKNTRDRHQKGCDKNEGRLLYTCPMCVCDDTCPPSCSKKFHRSPYQISRRDNMKVHLRDVHKWIPRDIPESWLQRPFRLVLPVQNASVNERGDIDEETEANAEISDQLSDQAEKLSIKENDETNIEMNYPSQSHDWNVEDSWL